MEPLHGPVHLKGKASSVINLHIKEAAWPSGLAV